MRRRVKSSASTKPNSIIQMMVTQLASPGLSHGKKGMRGMKNSTALIATARRIQVVLRRISLCVASELFENTDTLYFHNLTCYSSRNFCKKTGLKDLFRKYKTSFQFTFMSSLNPNSLNPDFVSSIFCFCIPSGGSISTLTVSLIP